MKIGIITVTLAVRGLTTVILLYLLQIVFVKILKNTVSQSLNKSYEIAIVIINVTFVHNGLTRQDR